MPRTADQKDRSSPGRHWDCRVCIQPCTACCGLRQWERACTAVLFKSMLFQVSSLASKWNQSDAIEHVMQCKVPSTPCPIAGSHLCGKDRTGSAHSTIMSEGILEAIPCDLQVRSPHLDCTWQRLGKVWKSGAQGNSMRVLGLGPGH